MTAGLLVVDGQLTVGQFAAAELMVGNLLLNMDTLARRMVAMFFAFAYLAATHTLGFHREPFLEPVYHIDVMNVLFTNMIAA